MPKKYVISDKIFDKLWSQCKSYSDSDSYTRAMLSPLSKAHFEFFREFSLKDDAASIMLHNIYEAYYMSVSDILKAANDTKAAAARRFCIPLRTIEDWYSGKNKCAPYVRLMMLRYYHLINLGKFIITEAEQFYYSCKPNVYSTHCKKSSEIINENFFNDDMSVSESSVNTQFQDNVLPSSASIQHSDIFQSDDFLTEAYHSIEDVLGDSHKLSLPDTNLLKSDNSSRSKILKSTDHLDKFIKRNGD